MTVLDELSSKLSSVKLPANATAAAAASSSPCSAIDILPSEILVSILENLTYGDLKLRIPLVCRRFRELVLKKNAESASAIDRILWRDAPRPLPNKEIPEINPIFPKFIFLYTRSVSDVQFRSNKGTKGEKLENLVDIPVRLENATNPSVGKATLHIDLTAKGFEPPYEVNGTGGGGALTVLDVMKAVADVVEIQGEDPDVRGYLGWGDNGFDDVKVTDGHLHLYDGMRPGYGNQ